MKAPTTPPAGALLFAIFNRLSNLPLFLLCPEEQFRFVHANEAVLQLSGHALEHLMTLRHPLHAKYPLIGIDQLWSQLDDSLHTEMDIRMNDGATRRLPVTLHSLAYEGTVYLLGYLHDQHVQRQLIEARQTTEQALAVRNRFLAHMSHELRTPLNGILGLSHLARDTESLALAHDYFQQIHRSGIHLQTILSDILDFCQIETGSIILNPVSFSLKNLIDDILQTVKTRAFGKHLVLRSDVDPALPVYLLGDVVRLRHILHPLVDNAVKFTEAGEVCVTVTLNRPTQPDLMQVRFIVKDTGMGISPENQSRLFHPFEQLDASDNRRHQGLGLGLALAGHLVKLMGGGGIKTDSIPGQGSTFSLVLPFNPAQASITRPSQVQVVGDLPLNGLNILVVEDNAINQKILCALLKKAGAVTTVAEDGSVAVGLLKHCPPNTYDVILMDIQMPVMDGYTATRVIRTELKLAQIPIIATTAHSLSSDREACLQAGMNDHISKPIQPQALIVTILRNQPTPATVLLNPGLEDSDSPLRLVSLANTHRAFKEALPNLHTVLTSLGNDEHLYCELVRLFVTQQAQSVERLEQLIREGDAAGAKNLAATLKGLSNDLGLLPLHQALCKLDFRLQSCPLSMVLPELEQTRIEMNTTIRALRQFLLVLPV